MSNETAIEALVKLGDVGVRGYQTGMLSEEDAAMILSAIEAGKIPGVFTSFQAAETATLAELQVEMESNKELRRQLADREISIAHLHEAMRTLPNAFNRYSIMDLRDMAERLNCPEWLKRNSYIESPNAEAQRVAPAPLVEEKGEKK